TVSACTSHSATGHLKQFSKNELDNLVGDTIHLKKLHSGLENGVHLRLRRYLVGQRIYEISTSPLKREPELREPKLFLESFKLLGAKEDLEKKPAAGSLNGTPLAVLLGKATKRVQPPYPKKAKKEVVSGTVRVHIEISEAGKVVSAEAVDGPFMLREAAVKAARQWEFAPTLVDSKPVKVSGVLVFNFTLQ
ncbi:MAG TPA: energy transducer TonB, partial [Blastocatellia bacterium]|nr:energy transducer TonB [Blastocatellia bacterium]